MIYEIYEIYGFRQETVTSARNIWRFFPDSNFLNEVKNTDSEWKQSNSISADP